MHLSRPEAANRIGVSLSTLDNLVRAGEIVYVRISPGRIAFREQDLENFSLAHRVVPVASRRRGVRRTRKHPA